MKRKMMAIIGSIFSVVLCFGVLSVPVMAEQNAIKADTDSNSGSNTDEKCVKTTIFRDNGQECYSGGIWGLLGIGIDVLTIGIGAAAVIGIIISGVQYSMASGEPATITKAKRRLYEIVIGLLLYGCFYGIMRWLVIGW